ncbi:molybdopterin cofactor-binding domain-containing protein [Aquamicrobium sp. LC103]|uniref:xanthine dehydrogenase family protein molybdopterin-binding subunit n=1 Tax=Aquamicrobium sp. LC103 TaxID=1120658 RepID=UPI00063E8E7F|nr:molybdopterin cofactor-binding domain-containing protein [Aquamicrobium sp. LC103]TKT75462.1 xanthine dehydrogenase family protein molybdopterin-binding subunit [Aquamicrobium sp. LC103]
MSRAGRIARRTFLVGAAAVAGGLAVGYYFYRKPFPNPLEDGLAEGEATFNPYVKIGSDDRVTVIVPRAEMGQGVATTLAALVAEELDVELDAIVVEHGPPASAYANVTMIKDGLPFPVFDESTLANLARDGVGVVGKFLAIQGTGGSTSTTDAFERMRQAGATAREMLKSAAAEKLGVAAGTLRTEAGRVVDPASERSLSYGELALDASALRPPSDAALRPRSDWRLLGRSQPRTDMHAKVTGAPIFGVDVSLPDMLFATVRMSPRRGARMVSIDAAEAEKLPGVVKIVPLRTYLGEGYGVIAKSTWHAFRAADAVEAEWGEAPFPPDDAGIWSELQRAMETDAGTALRNDGDVDTALADAPRERVVEAEYRVPFLAHATMEPMNATARFADGVLDIWAPNQAPTLLRTVCAREAGIEEAACNVHVTYLGGGFGRRLEADYAVFATRLAMEAGGAPVKVIWTREEDITHDMYRPAAIGRFTARLGENGLPEALDMKIAAPSIMASVMPRFYPALSALGPDATVVDGSYNQPYRIPNYRVAAVKAPLPLPVGFWRSVGNSYNGYFHECFMDEIAHSSATDPIELRRRLMTDFPTALGAIEKVADMARWGDPLPDRRARGFAFTLSFGSWVAEIVEIADTPEGIRIEKVWIAADVGTALDPSIVEAQLFSGAIYGLSAAMNQEITFADGMVEQSNFHDFDAMRIHQCPQFEVAILENAGRMGGAGEIGTPPAVAALANAVFALTGKRVRQLPLSREVAFA